MSSSRTTPLAALLLSLALAPTVAAGVGGHRADLRVGPLIGGQDLVVDMRSTHPSALGAMIFGFDGTPIAGSGPLDPIFGLNVATARIIFRVLDAQGRDFVTVPTAPGDFGPVGLGVVVRFQYLVAPASGPFVVSNLVSVEGEPTAVPTDFLTDEASTRLPAGYDTLNASIVRAGDLDRDGDDDLVVSANDAVLVWMNDGTGHYTDETAARLPYPVGSAAGALAVLDVNGDNRIDIVTGGGFDDSQIDTQPDRLWINMGNGTFVENPNGFITAPGLVADFAFGDFDLDGHLDVAVAVGEEGHVLTPTGSSRLFVGSGGFYPTFTEVPAFAVASWNDPSIGLLDIEAGDVDGDGDLDLVAALSDVTGIDGTPGQPDLVLLNDGTANFSENALALSPNSDDNGQGVVLGDFDLDGDLDIVFSNSHGSISSGSSGDLYWNQGGAQAGLEGVFVEDASSALEVSTPADWVRLSVHAQDADADGDLDLLLTIHDLFLGAEHMLFLNDGGAQGGVVGDFVRQTWFDPGDFISYGAAFTDIDLDGDLDLIQTAQGVVSGDPLLGDDVRLYVNSNL